MLQFLVFFLQLYYLHLSLLLVQIKLVFSLSQFVIEVELILIVVLVNVLLSVLHEAVPQSDHELEHLLQIGDVFRAVLHVEVPFLCDSANIREHLLHELLLELD